MPKFDL